MSHYNINYKDLSGKEKQDKAVQDCKEYVSNDKQWAAIEDCAKHPDNSFNDFRIGLGLFVGIEGYPVAALWLHFGRELPVEE